MPKSSHPGGAKCLFAACYFIFTEGPCLVRACSSLVHITSVSSFLFLCEWFLVALVSQLTKSTFDSYRQYVEGWVNLHDLLVQLGQNRHLDFILTGSAVGVPNMSNETNKQQPVVSKKYSYSQSSSMSEIPCFMNVRRMRMHVLVKLISTVGDSSVGLGGGDGGRGQPTWLEFGSLGVQFRVLYKNRKQKTDQKSGTC